MCFTYITVVHATELVDCCDRTSFRSVENMESPLGLVPPLLIPVHVTTRRDSSCSARCYRCGAANGRGSCRVSRPIPLLSADPAGVGQRLPWSSEIWTETDARLERCGPTTRSGSNAKWFWPRVTSWRALVELVLNVTGWHRDESIDLYGRDMTNHLRPGPVIGSDACVGNRCI